MEGGHFGLGDSGLVLVRGRELVCSKEVSVSVAVRAHVDTHTFKSRSNPHSPYLSRCIYVYCICILLHLPRCVRGCIYKVCI